VKRTIKDSRCEENDKRLTDILEKVYLELKEEANEVSR
jgi:hypothetical protein